MKPEDTYDVCNCTIKRWEGQKHYNYRLFYRDPVTGTRRQKGGRRKGDLRDFVEGELYRRLLTSRNDGGGDPRAFTVRQALSYYRQQAEIGIGDRAPVGSGYLKKLAALEENYLTSFAFIDDPVDETEPRDYAKFMENLRQKGTQAASEAGRHLKRSVALAAKRFKCDTNPARDVDPPAAKSRTPSRTNKTILTTEQVNALIDHFDTLAGETNRSQVKETSQKLGLIVRIAAQTGMRIGEIIALRRENVDLAADRVHVKESVKASSDEIGPPKSDAGVRWIDYAPELSAYIERFCLDRGIEDGLIFRTGTGNVISRSNLSRVLRPVIANLEFPKTGFHGLRHYFVSRLIAQGVDPKTIISYVGHTDYAFTIKQYSHLMRESQTSKAFVSL